MSVSMYTSQVNRLKGELATLRSSVADVRKKLAAANAKGLKAVESLKKASSDSQFRTRARDVERHQKAAAELEKKAADLEKKIVAKEKSVASAQASLDRATKTQQKTDDRDTEKRRKAELDHIKDLERARRAATSLPESFEPRPSPPRASRPTSDFSDTYDVCLLSPVSSATMSRGSRSR